MTFMKNKDSPLEYFFSEPDTLEANPMNNFTPRKPYLSGWLITADPLILTSLDELIFILKIFLPFYKTS
jgi:hypothetical protein